MDHVQAQPSDPEHGRPITAATVQRHHWVNAGVVGLAIAVVLGLVVGRSAAPRRPTTTQAATHLASVSDFVSVSRDGRTLTAFAIAGPCGDYVHNELLAKVTATRVSVVMRVEGRRYSASQLEHMVCATWGTFGPRAPLPSIRLSEPLGARAVVDALTGRPIPTYGGSLIARPTVLPRGCVPGAVEPRSDVITNGPPYARGFHPGVSWTCAVATSFPSSRFGPASTLEVGQWRGRIGSLGLPVERRASVHGLPAIIKVAAVNSPTDVIARSVSWMQGATTYIVTSYSGLAASPAHSRAVLSDAELLAIADAMVVATPAASSR